MQAGWFVGLYDSDEAGVQAMQRQWGPEKCIAARLDVTLPQGWGTIRDTINDNFHIIRPEKFRVVG